MKYVFRNYPKKKEKISLLCLFGDFDHILEATLLFPNNLWILPWSVLHKKSSSTYRKFDLILNCFPMTNCRPFAFSCGVQTCRSDCELTLMSSGLPSPIWYDRYMPLSCLSDLAFMYPINISLGGSSQVTTVSSSCSSDIACWSFGSHLT